MNSLRPAYLFGGPLDGDTRLVSDRSERAAFPIPARPADWPYGSGRIVVYRLRLDADQPVRHQDGVIFDFDHEEHTP